MQPHKIGRNAALIFLLGTIVILSSDCGKKKKEKEAPLKPLRIENLAVRFEKDQEKTSILYVEYETYGAKYDKGSSVWAGDVVDRWKLRDSKGILVYVQKLPRDFTVSEADAPLKIRAPGLKMNKLLDPGQYTFELKVFDKKSARSAKKKISIVKQGPPGARPGAAGARPGAAGTRPGAAGTRPGAAPPRVPAGYKTLPMCGLYVKLPRKSWIGKGPEGKNDRVTIKKKGTMDVIKAKAAMTLKSHIKISKKIRGFKKFIKKKKKGKKFWAVHLMKVKRKKLYVFMQVMQRRGGLWSCIGRSKKKKAYKTFLKVCNSLK